MIRACFGGKEVIHREGMDLPDAGQEMIKRFEEGGALVGRVPPAVIDRPRRGAEDERMRVARETFEVFNVRRELVIAEQEPLHVRGVNQADFLLVGVEPAGEAGKC